MLASFVLVAPGVALRDRLGQLEDDELRDSRAPLEAHAVRVQDHQEAFPRPS